MRGPKVGRLRDGVHYVLRVLVLCQVQGKSLWVCCHSRMTAAPGRSVVCLIVTGFVVTDASREAAKMGASAQGGRNYG